MSNAEEKRPANGEDQKAALLSSFRLFLEADREGAKTDCNPAVTEKQVDLFTLFSELAALKNEVKLEARQFKKALEQLQSVTENSQNDHAALLAELDRSYTTIAEQKLRKTLRPLLIQLVDLSDRIDAGIVAGEKFKPGFFGPRNREVIHGLKEGQALTRKRLEQILASCDVHPIATKDQVLDPHAMRAVESEHRKGIPYGVVTEEVRKGFAWGDEVLRPAEVKVNKSGSDKGPNQ